MKKLLIGLLTVSMSTAVASNAVSCTNFKVNELNEPLKIENPNADGGTKQGEQLLKTYNKSKSMKWGEVLTKDYSSSSEKGPQARSANLYNSTTKSTLADKELLNIKGDLSFTPYTDIGIVEDTAEYLLKEKGVSSKHHVDAQKSLIDKNNEYNNLGKLINNKEIFSDNDGITLGFMQNASDEDKLVPMWDAAPNRSANKSAEWFKKRFTEWTKNGLKTEKLTISFGPFANSLWHEAYKNNLTEEELADKLQEISKKYSTKKFDFYFAAPYLSNKGSYADSQRLLAGALKILLEKHNDFDIRLSLVVSTEDGISSVAGQESWNGDISLLSDEEFPLFMFTKYLGTNFRLNLVLPYLTYTDKHSSNEDWELPIMKKAIDNTKNTWKIMDQNVNGNNQTKDDKFYFKHMGVTPWIGRRAEKAVYNFTAKDALGLREFAKGKGLGQISMFYLTRDYPSKFESNNESKEALADKNPLDQNIRSGAGFEKLTFAKILSGHLNEAKDEVTKAEDLEKLDGYIDYEKNIKNNKALDEIIQKEPNQWDGVSGSTPGDGNVVAPSTPSTSSKSNYISWKDANPNRSSKINQKANPNGSTYFSPYLDAGLYEGNDISKIREVSGLDHLTLAFVQQVNSHSNYLDLSIAGIENKGEGFDWWEKSQLYEKDLKPLIESNNFKNIKVAYGGATTGGYIEKNPWNVAYKQANGDINKAAELLEEALVKFNQSLVDLAKRKNHNVEMPKNIDFDIEGQAQNDETGNAVLAKTLANMKKKDSSWNFSITLPVLPTGLTGVGYNVMDKFTNAYKNAGISYKDLPVTNLMLMDYGNPIYEEAIRQGKTNFDLAKEAVDNTRDNIAKSIMNNYKVSDLLKKDIYKLIGATPMIGVNDTVSGVFTLEDAKELYNWTQNVGLAYLSMWSVNDDRGKNANGVGVAKSLVNHGLSYLREYDFSKAFNGSWDDGVKNPSDKA